jgi:hypothetical protein
VFSSQSKKFRDTVALSFVCGNYCPTIDELGSKDSYRKLRQNCVISFYFRLYLILHANV